MTHALQEPADDRLPDRIESVEQLEEVMSRPTAAAIAGLSEVPGDLVLLGVGGKMGPTLARMAVRATRAAGGKRRVIGVSRFSEPGLEAKLNAARVETVRCDLLDPRQVETLPDAANVVAMTGMKFGASSQPELTWAMNAHVPALVCRRYAASRVVAFSTGNVYALSPVVLGGSTERDAPAPVGEYAASALARERMYAYFAKAHGTPTAILRLNYAQDLRYGVLVDLARKVAAGEPIDLAMGNFNALWQGDANAMALAAFAHAASAAFIVNLAGPETVSVRRVCEAFGQRLGRDPRFVGSESADALLSDGQLGHHLYGYPRVSLSRMVGWIAEWVRASGASLGKPTHFEVRDGKY